MSKLSKQDIKDETEGILYECNGEKVLTITFGGISQGLGIPIFEFVKTLRSFSCDQIFVRDFNQVWYQKGVAPHHSILALLQHLKSQIEKSNYQKVVCIGNSMGGYAAMLFGSLLDVDQVIAFAPQTFVDKKNRWRNFDFRWPKQMKNLHRLDDMDNSFFDLKSFLISHSRRPNIHIYYSEDDRLDRIHAQRLADFENINLIPKDGGHKMVKELKESNQLSEILRKVIALKS